MYAENQLVPAMKVLMMPFLYQDLDDTMKVYRSEVGAAWKATAEQKGVKLLNLVMFPAPDDEIILTTKPVKVPADVKGTVLRVVGPETAALAKKWGAGASFISGAEVYLALQRGTVHGAFNSLTTYVERKLYEVGPYVIFLPSINVQTFIAINKGFFERLAPPQQKAILDASATIEANTKQVAEKTLKEALEEAKKKGKLYTPTAAELDLWREGTSSIWEEMASKSPDVAAALKKTRSILNR
jgi:C4-dicarboxylate-binding protein DctP